MQALLAKLTADFPALTFLPGEAFCWSPSNKQIVYKTDFSKKKVGVWSLLHEVGHAALDHSTYQSDFELLQLEAAAWDTACGLAQTYGHEIDEDHVQDCLDTYRDWLHRRSTCPACGNKSLQESTRQYACFNCDTRWYVTASRFCRPYRRVKDMKNEIRNMEYGEDVQTKKSPASDKKQATFI